MEDKITTLRSFTYQSRCDTYSRIGHRAIQIGHHMLVFGGVNSQSQFTIPILRINCQTMQVESIQTKNNLKVQGFSLFSYKNHIYIWGGSGPEELYNSLWCFTGDEFQAIPQSGIIPPPRHFHASCFFSQRYLLIYGGMNSCEVCTDWHILDCHTMSWNSIFSTFNIPYSLNSHIFWNGGRGFLITSESFDTVNECVVYQNQLYEFKFTDFHQRRIRIDPINVSSNAKLTHHRGSPTVILLNLESPYLMMLGGERLADRDKLTYYNDLWIFNLETLEWMSGKLPLSVGFGFEAIVFQQRLYMIGGVDNISKELSNVIEVIDINADSIQAKICQSCREMYGLKEYAQPNRRFSIKYEYQQKPKTFFSGRLIHKFARFIKNPISAIGLMIDNSFNLSGTCLNIEFKQFESREKKSWNSKNQSQSSTMQKDVSSSMAEKIGQTGLILPYNYIKIADNSFGFTHDQILEGMYSFSIKTQKLTSDKKYEEELQIRKQYGVNLKIGALRLGKSCLFVTKTEDNYLFVCYFSCIEEYQNAQFKIYSYFKTNDKEVSSDINRSIISKNVKGCIPDEYQEMEANVTTIIYIFHLEQEIRKEVVDMDSVRIQYEHSKSIFFKDLKRYLECLYMTPFIGRVIKLENQVIKYKHLNTIFKKELANNKIERIDTTHCQTFFRQIEIYQSIDGSYPMQEILVYYENRLICSFDTKGTGIFGVIQIPKAINVDICKTKIQNYGDEVQLIKFIAHLTENAKRKYPSRNDNPPRHNDMD